MVLKDHKSAEAISLARSCDDASIRAAVQEEGLELSENIPQTVENAKPVLFRLTYNVADDVRDLIIEGVQKIKFTGLNWTFVEVQNLEG